MHVAVTSEHTLVSQSIAAALSREGTRATVVAWPRARASVPMPRAPVPPPFDAGLVLSSLDLWSRLRGARSVMTAVATRWVVLTDAPRGPVWGAVLAYGATAVLPPDAPLRTVLAVLAGAARGERRLSADEAQELGEQWARLETAHEQASQQFSTLTPREREVLWHLYQGDSVARTAAMMEVSLSTVRSQVKSVLRKLRVNTQLGAVAAMHDYLELEPPRIQPASDADDDSPPLDLKS